MPVFLSGEKYFFSGQTFYVKICYGHICKLIIPNDIPILDSVCSEIKVQPVPTLPMISIEISNIQNNVEIVVHYNNR